MAFPVHRMRRLRVSESMRRLVRETRLDPAQFVLPLFAIPGEGVRKEISSMPGHAQLLGHPGVHLHDYGKKPRPGRKLGHLTVVEDDAARCERRARRLLAELAPEIHIP